MIQSAQVDRPFRIVASRFLHEDFSNLMNCAWSKEESWLVNVPIFIEKVSIWKNEVYGSLTRRKKRILSRLEGLNNNIQRTGETSSLCTLQKSLRRELDFRSWLSSNIQSRFYVDNLKWKEIFAVTCWILWRRRNERVHSSSCPSTPEGVAEIKGILNCMSKAREFSRDDNELADCLAKEGCAGDKGIRILPADSATAFLYSRGFS